MLETADYVFTYVGALRYPATSCGLLFKPELESTRADSAVATPFDSGAIAKHLSIPGDDAARTEFLRQHEMPVPEYREYFQHTLRLLFQSPWHYVEGIGPDVAGPVQVGGGDARRWTFEVRFAEQIALRGVLMAVFLPVAVAAMMTREIATWRRAGVDVRAYLSPDATSAGEWTSLQDTAIRYLKEQLA